MTDQPMGRREFSKSLAAGAAGILLGGNTTMAAEPAKQIKIDEPFHGAILNRRHGTQTTEGLKIQVCGQAPAGGQVTVNGSPARREGEKFLAEILLTQPETDIRAVWQGDGGPQQQQVRVVWDRYSEPRYRFSIDDNSFFLRDVAQKGYASLFDCFYLKGLRDLNKKYGVKFTVNIYYTTGDDFSLPQFPDRYKGEWRDNASWLRLAFHANADKPDRPYQDAPAERLAADFDRVAEQIHRFAGPEAYAPPTVIHWAMLRAESLPILAKRGVKVLSGYFRRGRGRAWDINYCIDDIRSEYLSRHDALKDFATGIIFSRVDIVCNSTPLDRIAPTLAAAAADPKEAEIMDLFTHEQYFWKFYSHYIPDHFQRLDAALGWVTERGYKPVFFHEGLLGGRA